MKVFICVLVAFNICSGVKQGGYGGGGGYGNGNGGNHLNIVFETTLLHFIFCQALAMVDMEVII